jgi:tyrosinase
VRSTKSFGYTYPELVNNASVSEVKAAINKLYGSNSGNDSLLSKRFFDFGPPEPESGSNFAPTKRDTSTKYGPTKRREYIANIVSDKFSCNGSYAVYIFLGTFDALDPACWPTQPNLVGTHAVFATVPQEATDSGQSTKRAVKAGIQVTGTIPLNSALLEKAKAGEMRSRDPGHVEDYLTKNLQYRVARVSFNPPPPTSSRTLANQKHHSSTAPKSPSPKSQTSPSASSARTSRPPRKTTSSPAGITSSRFGVSLTVLALGALPDDFPRP